MSLRPDQLAAALETSLAPVYLLAGAEPLLLQECRDEVIRAARSRGFTERSVYEVRGHFDWSQLSEEGAALSLFSSQKILDIRLPTGKPGQEGAKVLAEMACAADPDVLLLVSCGDWSGAMRKLKWTGELARAGVLVEIWPVKPRELPGWIRNRMAAAGLAPEPEAMALLAEMVEGNLLAAQQEIDKLLLAGGSRRVGVDDVRQSVANSARFDSFRLVECALAGQLDECLRVASGLQRTGVAIQLIYAVLYRELSLADKVRAAVDSGEQQGAAFKKLRIWPARQGPVKAVCGRLKADDFADAFRVLALIDRQSKGRAPGDAWQTLDRLLWFLCSPSSASLP